ncbi:FecR family protein [Sphingomonas sp.]|uniref:FecR family protein n=1 Tax=Sphingomonas sp. TaxID=28214 RepID=UPI0035B0774B
MRSPDDDPVRAAVLDWAVRTSDPSFEDWDAFGAWLDGAPERGRAYDAVMIAVAEAADAMKADAEDRATAAPVRLRVVPPPPVRHRRRVFAGMAMAAGVAGLFVATRVPHVAPVRMIEAPAGAPQRIALADGSVIELAGGSRLELDPARPRYAAVRSGRAMFSVRHDAAAPFRVRAGRHDIVDTGTAFDVTQRGGTTEVAVAEGAVIVDPGSAAIPLDAGGAAILRVGAAPRTFAVAADTVGQWRRDRLSYREAPLAQVATDLSAAFGRPVALGPGLEGRRFTGTLVVAGLRERPAELAALLDVGIRGDGKGWELRVK